VSPACHDTIPADPDEHDEPTELRRVEGVDPAIAVWLPWERRRWAVYVNAGSFPGMASLAAPLGLLRASGGVDSFASSVCADN
jgi:hypothetical protein